MIETDLDCTRRYGIRVRSRCLQPARAVRIGRHNVGWSRPMWLASGPIARKSQAPHSRSGGTECPPFSLPLSHPQASVSAFFPCPSFSSPSLVGRLPCAASNLRISACNLRSCSACLAIFSSKSLACLGIPIGIPMGIPILPWVYPWVYPILDIQYWISMDIAWPFSPPKA